MIGVVLVVGYLAARFEWFGPHAPAVLSRAVLTVGLPTLVFSVIATSDLGDIFSVTGLVAIVSAVAMIAVFLVVGSVARWGAGRTIVGALSSGMVNSTNLGFPLSMYIFGSVTAVTSIMLFQLTVLTPLALAALDIVARGRRGTVWGVLLLPLRNPVTVAAIVAVAANLTGIRIPALILEPAALLSDMTIPLMLLLFGMSLNDARLRIERPDRWPVTIAVVLKSVVQPGLALVLARYVFDLDATATFVAVACACLPTAQNVVVYAMRYGQGLSAVRTTGIITTVLTIPLLMGAIALLQ